MIKISDVNSSGKGVGRQNGMVVFVPETISGETVEAEIISNQKNYKKKKIPSAHGPELKRVCGSL